MTEPIDVVITWVDGQDQQLAALRRQYATEQELSRDDVGGVTRYASLGEIFWCLASINRFAPWVHRIYIVTDGQDPHVEPFLQRHFPQGYIPVEIVDHRQIFAGYEQYLPTFNSLTIETMLWRIPGLSQRFIEMNDDFLLGAPVWPEDFYTQDGTPICYAGRRSLPFTRLGELLGMLRDGTRRATFKGAMINGALLAGSRWTYLKLDHTPRALLRSAYEESLALRPHLIEDNIRHRFRDATQFNSEELHYMYLFSQHRLCVKSLSGVYFYMHPKARKNHVARKLALFRQGDYKFCCFNDVNRASTEDLEAIKAQIEDKLGIRE